MTTNIGPHDRFALVSPQAFTERMEALWTQRFGLTSSPDLRTLWSITASTFCKTIIDGGVNDDGATWRVLRPPTGSGKTRGTCLFAAMQADANADSALLPVGVLIVTRLIAQADELTKEINEHAGRVVAVAHHSEKPASTEELHDSDILVITHQAYVSAAGKLGSSKDASWKRFVRWRGGNRRLTIIDEALANVVENNKVTLPDLAQALSYIPLDVQRAFPEQIRVLEELRMVLVRNADPTRPDYHTARMLWDDSHSVQLPEMGGLISAMKLLRYDELVLNEHNDSSRTKIARKVSETIAAATAVTAQWAYYAQRGTEHSINASAFLIPWDVPGPVVLDATANANFLWDLLGTRSQTVPTPPKARNYENVTLHVAQAGGLGKYNMIKTAKARFPRLLAALQSELGSDRSVFLCTHKATEHLGLTYARPFAKFDVGHWGAIDGRNNWQDHDAAVIFGLPYRDPVVWPTNQFFALQGCQDDDWLANPVWKQHENVRQVMQQRQLSVSIIQAINRVRCRRVIDEHGRSPAADIYIVLPKDKTGDAILQDIRADMPGLLVVPWAFELDGPKVRQARSSSSRDALIKLMDNRPTGETALSFVRAELSMDKGALKRLKEALRDPKHPTTAALSERGVSYVVKGAGRGAKTYLVKHAAWAPI